MDGLVVLDVEQTARLVLDGPAVTVVREVVKLQVATA